MRKDHTSIKYIALILTLIMCFSTNVYGASLSSEFNINAQSAISYCPETGQIIYSKNMNRPVVPASTTKLMTAIVVMENLDLNTKITTTKEVEKINEAEIFMKTGEVFTANELLHAMLIESANDAAVALAIATSGSVAEFAKLMNEKVKEMGLKNTHFVNPNGFKEDNHYTSAYDMTMIAQAAFENHTIRKIAGTKYYKIGATNMSGSRKIKNTNLLLPWKKKQEINDKMISTKDLGVYAGKTGTWDVNEASLVLGVKDDNMKFITVVFDTDYKIRESESIKLINYTKENIARNILFKKGDIIGTAYIKGGAKTRIHAAANSVGYVKLPDGALEEQVDIKIIRPANLKAPISKGDVVAKAAMCLDGKLLRSVNLISTEDVEEGWLPSQIGISNLDTLVILGIILAFVILITYKKKVKK